MKICVELNSEEINALQFTIVVEVFSKGILRTGKMRRAFKKEFPTHADYQRVHYWYRKFYNWYLVKGTPQFIRIRPDTLIFIKRLVHFCAEA